MIMQLTDADDMYYEANKNYQNEFKLATAGSGGGF
jgi:hypothetical protein